MKTLPHWFILLGIAAIFGCAIYIATPHKTFGVSAVVHTTGGDEVFVNGTSTGSFYVGGALTVAGPTSFTGGVSGAANTASIAMVSGTTTACSVTNTSGASRILFEIGGLFTATPSAGTFGLSVGTSTNNGTTSTTPLINTAITNSATTDVVATTSTIYTLSGATSSSISQVLWKNNEALDWITTTTTNNGFCKAAWY